MNKLKYLWDHLEETIAAVIVLVMAILNFSNVIARFVFDQPFPWADELTLMLFLWATMMGGATAFKRGSHFNMGLLSEGGSATRKIILAVIILVFNVLFSLLVFTTGIKMVTNQISFRGIIPTLQISQAYQGMAIPVGAFFMMIRSAEGFFATLKKVKADQI